MSNEEKRKGKIILEPQSLKKLLELRARGKSLEALAKIFHLNSRQMVNKIIEEHRNDTYLQKYYIEIDKTLTFLNRKI